MTYAVEFNNVSRLYGDVRAVVQDCREGGGCVTGIGDDVVPDLGEQGP